MKAEDTEHLQRCECCGKPAADCKRDAVGFHCYACRKWAAEMFGLALDEDEEDEE